jgi:transposase
MKIQLNSAIQKSSRLTESERLAHVLMYGDPKLNPLSKPLMSYSALSKILRCSINTVKRRLSRPMPFIDGEHQPRRHHMQKLDSTHMLFLLNDDRLQLWAHKTLAERCVLFHRSFPEVKITPSYLAALYKKYGVKRKAVKLVKTLPNHLS